jgi:hypothetical protein
LHALIARQPLMNSAQNIRAIIVRGPNGVYCNDLRTFNQMSFLFMA